VLLVGRAAYPEIIPSLLQELADPLAGCWVPRPLSGWSSSWELPRHFARPSSSGAFGTLHSCGSSVGRLPRVDSILFLALVFLHQVLESFPGCKVVVLGLVTAELAGY
jgi:hypothetical protein